MKPQGLPCDEEDMDMKMLPGGVTAPKGFQASGVHCGVKKGKGDGNQPPMSKMPEVLEGKKDLALIVSQQPCVAAAVYTMNRTSPPLSRGCPRRRHSSRRMAPTRPPTPL